MINYLKRKLKKRQQKKTFKEYGYEIKTFQIDKLGNIEYAQWLHPFEKPKEITSSKVKFYNTLARNGGMIVDIGAHTGDTSVPMALAVGKEGLVLGIEPNQYVFKILKKNSKLNTEYTNIHPYCFAATENEGIYTFNYSDASFCNGGFLTQIRNQHHKHNYQLKVTGRNLEKFLYSNYSDDLTKLDLIKIDAEGYDKEILKTIPNILKDYKPNLMVECYKRLTTKERYELFDILNEYNYTVFYLENFEIDGSKIKIERENMTDKKHFEMLAIHEAKI
ncbi:MAG: FkbM family methyltransferase [Bacteroidales bacterium]|nr:FkbM family methyltransferase [Bacteroidales bacterium]MBS3776339.1 FkbM family methyltransferase [Bacteroidales bacterium]